MERKKRSKKLVVLIVIILILILTFINLYCTYHRITSNEVEKIMPSLQPGDIVLERNEWRVTNLLYPGFWKHTFIYTGTLTEMDEYFKDNTLLNVSVSEYVQKNLPIAYKYYSEKFKGYDSNMIEAKHLSVRVGPMEVYAQSEYLAVLRPMVSKDTKLRAIFKALSFADKPYDVLFDYSDNSTLACSEIVYHAYDKGENSEGLGLRLARILWVDALLPNDMAKCFALENDSGQCRLEFVAFIDPDLGFDNMTDKNAFSESWKRSTITIVDGTAFD